MGGDGDGWVRCDQGHRHWGRYGAAGLLLRSRGLILLQLRAPWNHHGGTWGIPGGARDRGESAVAAALREATEETGLDPRAVRPEAVVRVEHGNWSYSTVVAAADGDVPATDVTSTETDELRWVAELRVADLPLHPGFAAGWPTVRAIGRAPTLVVDAANVIGSRPDGWWRDRAGAVRRLRDELAQALGDGLPLDEGEVRRVPPVVLVTEGAARGIEPVPGIEVVHAAGSGDDAIVELVADLVAEPVATMTAPTTANSAATTTADVIAGPTSGARPVVVVTADRQLRRRVRELGAEVRGPGVLLQRG